MILKTCTKHGNLSEESIYIYYSRKGTQCYRCRLCMNETSKRTYARYGKYKGKRKIYGDKINEYQIKYKKNCPDFKEKRKKYYAVSKRWREKYKCTEKFKIARQKTRRKAVDECQPHYIKKLLKRQDKAELIPYEGAVQLYAAMLKLKRAIKEKRKIDNG